MKVLKTIEGGTVIEGICLRKKIKINRGGPPVYSVPRSMSCDYIEDRSVKLSFIMNVFYNYFYYWSPHNQGFAIVINCTQYSPFLLNDLLFEKEVKVSVCVYKVFGN